MSDVIKPHMASRKLSEDALEQKKQEKEQAKEIYIYSSKKFRDLDCFMSAAQLSDKYITDRALPDKAIDLLDEAGSRARLKLSIAPSEFKEKEAELEEVGKEKNAAIYGQEFEKAAKLREREKEMKKALEGTVNFTQSFIISAARSASDRS